MHITLSYKSLMTKKAFGAHICKFIRIMHYYHGMVVVPGAVNDTILERVLVQRNNEFLHMCEEFEQIDSKYRYRKDSYIELLAH